MIDLDALYSDKVEERQKALRMKFNDAELSEEERAKMAEESMRILEQAYEEAKEYLNQDKAPS
jgi:RNAse (barnase) inhibitor barstar